MGARYLPRPPGRGAAPAPAAALSGLLPALLFALLLAGCRGAAGRERVTLRVMNWAADLEVEMEQRIARRFEERWPGVRVSVESVVTNYGEKLVTAIASGTPPDVFLLDSPDIPTFVDRGLVLDLAPYAGRVGFRAAEVFPEVANIFRRGEQLYAFPKGFTPMVVFYNRRLFRELGVPPPPDTGWDWEAFLARARAVTRDTDGDGTTDIYAINFPRLLYEWIPWVWSAGGDIFDPRGTRATGYLDAPATVEAFRFLTELVTRWKVSPPVQYLRSLDPAQLGRFYVGRQAMLVSGHWSLPRLRHYARQGAMEIGVAPIPHRQGVPARTVIYASGWAVPANVRNRRLAVELAAFLAGPEAQRLRAASGLEIPARRDVARELAGRDTAGLEEAFLRLAEGGRMTWGALVPDFHEVEELSTEIMDRHLLRGEELAAAAGEVARRIDRALAR